MNWFAFIGRQLARIRFSQQYLSVILQTLSSLAMILLYLDLSEDISIGLGGYIVLVALLLLIFAFFGYFFDKSNIRMKDQEKTLETSIDGMGLIYDRALIPKLRALLLDIDPYWEQRYRAGRTSGKGSVKFKEEVWQIINHFPFKSVLDFGCGDMQFVDGQILGKDYFGVDISPTILEKNRQTYNVPLDRYIPPRKFDITLCISVLFHIQTFIEIKNILEQIALITQERIYIVSWYRNPLTKPSEYQFYHDMTQINDCLEQLDFKKIFYKELDESNALYVFQKKSL